MGVHVSSPYVFFVFKCPHWKTAHISRWPAEKPQDTLLKQDDECMFWWPDEPVLVFYPVGHVVAVWWCELRLSFPLILLRSTWPHCDARATENCHWCTECSPVWPAANQSSSAQHPPPQGSQWWNEWGGEKREKEENVSMNGNMEERTLVMSKPKYWELDPPHPSSLGLYLLSIYLYILSDCTLNYIHLCSSFITLCVPKPMNLKCASKYMYSVSKNKNYLLYTSTLNVLLCTNSSFCTQRLLQRSQHKFWKFQLPKIGLRNKTY